LYASDLQIGGEIAKKYLLEKGLLRKNEGELNCP
jgi:hypothetical protein